MAVSDWNTNPDLNTSIDAVNIAENCPPGNLNDMGRRIMASIKSWYNTVPTMADISAAISSAISAATAGMWTSSNDGSGSGLDADVWRGLSPAQFFATYFQSGANGNGVWRKVPDGAGGYLIEQWGYVASGANGMSAPYDFPIPFTAACDSINGTADTANPSAIDGNRISAKPISLTQYTIGCDDAAVGVYWRAIGR